MTSSNHPGEPRGAARYRGIFPVVPTTFTESGELDLESQKRCIDFMIDAGSDGLCILANFSEQFLLSDEEREYKNKRKQIQEKLIKFATRIPAFMYLTDFRENTLRDVITKLEPALFQTVTGLKVEDFHLLVQLKVFNTEQMNQAVFAFRRYEDASLRYTGIESHDGLTHYGLYDTVVARD